MNSAGMAGCNAIADICQMLPTRLPSRTAAQHLATFPPAWISADSAVEGSSPAILPAVCALGHVQ
eukprot:5846152-Amphidinium_carterae.2